MITVSAFVFLVLVFCVWISRDRLAVGTFKGDIQQISNVSSTHTASTTLKVLTWNLAYGHGLGSEGKGYYQKDAEHYQITIDKMAELIKNSMADVVLFQEIDFHSKRSHLVDQAKALAEKAGFNYIAYAPSWDMNYIPFPYWPISNQFGRIKSGGAVISKYPILKNDVLLFPKPADNPWWYNLFYLYRFCQSVQIDINGKLFKLANTHLEAFNPATRLLQVNEMAKWLPSDLDIIGGDFNSLEKAHPLVDSPDEDYGEETLAEWRKLTGHRATILLDEKEVTHRFTFPSNKPDRRLDHVFYRPVKLKYVEEKVLTNAGILSDHLPTLVSFEVL